MKKWGQWAGLILAPLFLGCCQQLVIDRSIPAVEAGDYTLMISACSGMPGRGADICRVKEGADIDSSLKLVVPFDKAIKGGELTLYYRDFSKTYPITGKVIEIPWAEFFAEAKWDSSMDGQVLALAEIRYTEDTGIEEIVRARGIAILVVTKAGYDPLPLDSGFEAWKTTCTISYTTAGRSAITCK